MPCGDVWDQLLDKLLNIGADIPEPKAGQTTLDGSAAAAPHQTAATASSSTIHRGHMRTGSDVMKLIEKDDLRGSRGVASSPRLSFQRQGSLGRLPSLETVSENGQEDLEASGDAGRKFAVPNLDMNFTMYGTYL